MRFGTGILLGFLLALGGGSAAFAQAQPVAASPAARGGSDFRAAFRAQIEDELTQLRPRLKLVEEDARQQADKYKEMAASKAEMAHKSQEKTQAARARADAAAAKKGYAPKLPGKAGGAGGAKKPAAADAKAEGGDKAKGGDAGGGGAAAPKKVDPVLTQQYVVMSLRDQIRQLRDRIAYLEGLLAKL